MFFNLLYGFRKDLVVSENGYQNLTEEDFVKWFDHRQVGYIYFNQSPETFSPLFSGNLHRPDFLVAVPGIGSILVDVKERELKTKYGTVVLDEADTQAYQQLQQRFKLPVWFAFTIQGAGHASWHWISLDEVFENTDIMSSSTSGQPFRGIPLTHCKTLGWDDGLSKLISSN